MKKIFITNKSELHEWSDNFSSSVFSLDTETTGLSYDCDITGLSICDGETACYVDFLKLGIEFIGSFGKRIEKATGIIMHNAVFDLRVLEKYDIFPTAKIYDTMIANHLLNERVSCGLKKLAIRVLKVDPSNILTYKQASNDGHSTSRFYDYAINDSIWTYELYEITKPLIEKQGLHKLFYDIEMPFQFVLLGMFKKGVRLDKNKLIKFEKFLMKEKIKYEELAYTSIGKKIRVDTDLFGGKINHYPMNLNSSKQVAEIIEKSGLKLTETETGLPSTSVEVLKKLKDKTDFIKYLLKYRKAEKQLSTFVKPYFKLIYSDGRIRTNFNDTIAVTGRLSSSHPNLQNLPRKSSSEDLVNIRELFIPKDGYTFIRADYSAQELRQLANLSDDPLLIDAFNTNKDLHLVSANGCLGLGIPADKMVKTHPEFNAIKEKFSEERHIGKNGINFPIIYGSTAVGISKGNNVTEKVAQSWIDGFFKLYPKVAVALKECKSELFRNHYVTNYFGRKRRFSEIDNKAVRQAFNFKIQGFCADLLRLVMKNLNKLYANHPEWDANIVITVHDSIDIEIKKEFAQVGLEETRKVMETSLVLQVPFIVDINLGDDIDG